MTELAIDSIREVRQIRVESYRITGAMELAGGVRFAGGREAEIRDAQGSLRRGEIRIGEERVAQDLEARLELSTEPFSPRPGGAAAFWAAATGQFRLAGQVQGGALLNAMLRGPRAPRFDRAPGRLALEAALERGRLTEGSSLELRSREGAVRFLGWYGAGRTSVRGRVEAGEAGPRLRLAAEIDEVRVAADDAPERPFLAAPRLRLEAELGAEPARLAAGDSPVTALELEMCDGEIPDLGSLAFLLPESAGLRIDGGRGRLDLDARLADGGSHGRMELAVEGIRGAYQGSPVEGRLRLHLPLAGAEPRASRLSITGARLDLEAHFPDGEDPAEPWSGDVRILDGSIDLERPHRAVGSVRLTMTDTRPLVEHFARSSRLVDLLSGLLRIRDVAGTARAELAPRRILLEDARVTGRGLELLAHLRLTDGDARGILYTKFRALTFGVERAGEETDLRLRKPRRWYEEAAARWREGEPSQSRCP